MWQQVAVWLPLAVATSVHMEHFSHGDHCNVERIPYRDMSLDRFQREYEGLKPVILTNSTSGWPAHEHWQLNPFVEAIPKSNKDRWLRKWGRWGNVSGYMHRMVADLFDPAGNEQHYNQIDITAITEYPELEQHYTRPHLIRNLLPDIFSALPNGQNDFKRLRMWRCEAWPWQYHILSPSRSGGPWHIDPPETAFWNALVSGQKHWVIAPLSQSNDDAFQGSVGFDGSAEELEAHEWFDRSYKEWWAGGGLSCVQQPGDVVYVPVGWAHTALALQPSVGVSEQVVTEVQIAEYAQYQVRRVGWLCRRYAVGRQEEEYLEFMNLPILCAKMVRLEGLQLAEQQKVRAACQRHVLDSACQKHHDSMPGLVEEPILLDLFTQSLELLKALGSGSTSDL